MFGNPSDEGIFLLVDGTRPMAGHLTLADLPDALTSGDYAIQMKSGISDSATAQGYVFDTVNILATTGARLFDFKMGGVDRFHYEANGTFEFAHIPSGSLYIQDYVADPFTALGVDTTSILSGVGQQPTAFELVARVQGTGILAFPTAMKLTSRVESHGGVSQTRAMELIGEQASNIDLSAMWGILATLKTTAGSTGGGGAATGVQVSALWSGSKSAVIINGFKVMDMTSGSANSQDATVNGLLVDDQTTGSARRAIHLNGTTHGVDIVYGRDSEEQASIGWNSNDLMLSASLSGIDGTIAALSNTVIANTNAPTLGSNLVTNGDFSAGGTGWTAGIGWQFIANNADHFTSGISSLTQVVTGLTVGRLYEIKYTLAGSDPSNRADVEIGSILLTRYSKPGTYTDYFVATVSNPLISFSAVPNGALFTIDDVFVREVLSGDLYVSNDIEARNDILVGNDILLAEGSNLVLGTVTGTMIGTAANEKLGFFGTTPVIQPSAYTVTNPSTDRAFDVNSTSVNELAAVLGTVITDLQALGLVA